MAQLVFENATVGYEHQPVVVGLNFSVNKGDYLCIVGENGSGKTTLMKTILRLQPLLSGKMICGDGFIPSEIGYLPQQTEMQRDFPASVYEIVLSGCLARKGKKPFYGKEEKNLVQQIMEKTEISAFQKKCYRELSGGQQQRVLLARSLCAARQMILLDEPVSGLDPHATAEMYSMIKKLNNEGVSIIMISHDIQNALSQANMILHIGKKVFFGTSAEYLKCRANIFNAKGDCNEHF